LDIPPQFESPAGGDECPLAAYDRGVTQGVSTTPESAADPSRADGGGDVVGTAVLEREPERVPIRVAVPQAIRDKLAPRIPGAWWVSWLATGWVVAIAGILRGFHFDVPTGIMFDETYYAKEGEDYLQYGVEWNRDSNTPAFVVHPPLGKWLIAAGIWLTENNSYGWRISCVVAGTVAVLIITRTARRLFRSTVLGCAAGLLMALDGFQFVLSRVAILDIFVLFFVLAAFAFLVLDRDQRRLRWLRALESGIDPSQPGKRNRPPFQWRFVPWFRYGAAIMLGAACGVKWSAVVFAPLFILLVVMWEISVRRTVGVRHPWRDTFLDEIWSVIGFIVLAPLAYLATWTGWFMAEDAWKRHYLSGELGQPANAVYEAIFNLVHYHIDVFRFHDDLTSPHTYQSWPWQWLLLGRPVAIYYGNDPSCGAPSCASEIILLGTPILWWSFIPALVALAWFGISRRDWRALAIGGGAAMGIVPWFYYQLQDRTMFYFYASPAEPFLILAVVYVLGAIINSPAMGRPGAKLTILQEDRRLYGTLFAAFYVIAVAVCFWYFWPLYTAQSIPYDSWWQHLWLGNRWV
jgi:dolichyl-phosphate-mannose--protein O-mannosyl transferase